MKVTLKKYGLSDLYEIFAQEKITVGILWDLTEKEIIEIGLKLGQRHRYIRAKLDYLEKYQTETVLDVNYHHGVHAKQENI